MTDQDVRDLLERMAAEEPIPLFDAAPLTRRARYRAARTLVVAAVGVAAAIAVLFAGVAEIRTAPLPADQPTPTPVASGALAYAFDGDIYVADPDGSNAVKIADAVVDAGCGGISEYETPSWSPDGMFLAFWHPRCRLSGDRLNPADVVITGPDGNVVAKVPAEGWGFDWSPDSTRVAVWGTFGETIDVYGVDGERQASLPLPPRMYPHNDSGPGVWMPDGSALLLYGVFVVPLDGSAPHKLSLGGQDLGGEASYSPDGTRVAVDSDNSITVMNADGSPVSEVDAPPISHELTWSPAGDRFATLSDGGLLLVVDVASGTATVLTEARAALSDGRVILDIPAFSPQGDRILYASGDGAGGGMALYSIGVDGSDARLVVAGTTQGDWRSR